MLSIRIFHHIEKIKLLADIIVNLFSRQNLINSLNNGARTNISNIKIVTNGTVFYNIRYDSLTIRDLEYFQINSKIKKIKFSNELMSTLLFGLV